MPIRDIGPLAVFLVLMMPWLPACQNSDLGRFCVVGADPTDPSTAAEEKLNTSAPECEQRLCLGQRGYRCANGDASCVSSPNSHLPLKSICTQPCTQNADCTGGDENINGCRRYVCQKPAFGVMYDDCFCGCLDYMRDADGHPLELGAFNASNGACGN